MKKIRELFKYTYDYRKRYLFGIVFLIIVDICQLIPPKLIGVITDNISNGTASKGLLLKFILLIVLVAALMAIGRYVWRIFIVGSSRYVEYDIRNKFFTHLQSLSTNFYDDNKTGDLMALATNDLNAVRMALGQGVIMIIDAIVLTIATIVIMLSINVRLTLLSLLPLPFVSIVSLKFGKVMHRKFTVVQEAFSKLTDMVQENFSGIRIIKSFVQEESEFQKFDVENTNNFKANMSLIRIWGLFSPLVEFIASLGLVLLVALGGVYVIYGNISLGEFIAFNMYLANLIWPMMAIGWVINLIQRGFASLERIEKILKEKPEIFDVNTNPTATLKGDIVISNLSFKYKTMEKPALTNISLTVKSGQTLGIVGRTGSSKTTLVELLLRLYNVEDGKIFINNEDINRIPLNTLRENIGFVSQDSFLFSNIISENINLAFEELDMDKITQSTKDADIYDNIMDFPMGFETIVGERGVTLSGGQKQRTSIARALIKNPDILILDDCLSAVDAKTEVKILQNLKRIMKEKTSIIISHRISAVKDADTIIVMEEGEIIQRGTHAELTHEVGIYKDIYEKQLIEQQIQSVEEVEANGKL
ncbi:ABC transporter ATP-binding protein [Clostridium sp. CF012]|uniref:ABC transporter ATP-binding protein n=1 Tax=Clostridium sp. CF012 TaxID=2843319 RepID=UPI001C0BB94C|nr:ABC transporter ATP-binding protein [Clostridium sp. CF012]MBU3143490.1 ABC transporter ATP-binding protein/permease [Clostridium sp. CF012]